MPTYQETPVSQTAGETEAEMEPEATPAMGSPASLYWPGLRGARGVVRLNQVESSLVVSITQNNTGNRQRGERKNGCCHGV